MQTTAVIDVGNSLRTHWRYAIVAVRCLRTLIRRDVPLTPSQIRFFMEKSHDNHPSIVCFMVLSNELILISKHDWQRYVSPQPLYCWGTADWITVCPTSCDEEFAKHQAANILSECCWSSAGSQSQPIKTTNSYTAFTCINGQILERLQNTFWFATKRSRNVGGLITTSRILPYLWITLGCSLKRIHKVGWLGTTRSLYISRQIPPSQPSNRGIRPVKTP